jgi:hypothetical protein
MSWFGAVPAIGKHPKCADMALTSGMGSVSGIARRTRTAITQ